MSADQELENIREQALAELETPRGQDQIFTLEKKYLGRKGLLTAFLRKLKDQPLNKRRVLGQRANALKQSLAKRIEVLRAGLQSRRAAVEFDLTEPGREYAIGHTHPLTRVRWNLEEFFRTQGFSILEGPEVETDYYNFEALNIAADHPARDIWDTFYLKSKVFASAKKNQKSKLLLRTHTSPMQVRVMERHRPPLAVVVPGRTFRHEATDARHEHTFDQLEGFYVGRGVSAANLKDVLHSLFRFLFGPAVKVKLRPGYFPFTEPSFELVMSCPFCRQKGCSVCGNGWLEMLGAGMIHPKVFESAGYARGKWSGYAFGLGMARVAMLKYNIPDIRMFYQNDLRVLSQF